MAAIWGLIAPLRILCTRELQVSIKESFHAELKAAIASEPWLEAHYRVGIDYIKGANGTEFIFRGLRHNTASIKSLAKIDLTIVEEAEDVPEESWLALEATVFRQPDSELWAIWNPRLDSRLEDGRWTGSPVDIRFRKNPPENALVAKVNYNDNPFFPDGLETLRQREQERLDPATYAHIWDGEYLTNSDAQVLSGKVHVEAFEAETHWDGPYYGGDFGYSQDPLAAIECWIDGDTLYIRREASRVGVEQDDIPMFVKQRIPGFEREVARWDNARPETISYIKRHGLPRSTACEKWPGSVEDGIGYLRSFRRIVVHPDCPATISEARLYSYKVDRLTGDITTKIVDAHNHCIDAIRYALGPDDTASRQAKIKDKGGGFLMGMIKAFHPSLTPQRREEWDLMRCAMEGEATVKSKQAKYLPMPTGFASAADEGSALYRCYVNRARFPELLAPSVGAMIGIIHGQEIKIEVPSSLEYLWENADGRGLPLEAFHRRITRELLVIGGYSVLVDFEKGGGDPWLAGYNRDTLINWDDDWFLLDESSMVRKGFVWEQVEKYRLLNLDGLAYAAMLYGGENDEGEEIEVRGRGRRVLERIPFDVANAMDLSPKIEAPPLIGVANAAMSIYRKSADQEQSLYMSANPTLVAINGEAPEAVGAGVVHEMSGVEGQTPDLKYVEATNSGIKERREEMAADREAAVMAGARLFEQTTGNAESGEAKRLRYASETATLTSIAQSSCMLLERSLRNAAMIIGAPEDDISVQCPADLMDRTMSPQDFAALFGVYNQGGMSWETFFANGQQGGIFSTEQTADEEQKLLDDLPATGSEVV